MNGKQAKRLRKQVKALGLPEKTTYEVGEDSGWGPLPYIKDTRVVDKEKLIKILNKTKNPKFRTELTRGTWYQRFLRYLPGKPTKLELCERQVYQQMKKKLMVS